MALSINAATHGPLHGTLLVVAKSLEALQALEALEQIVRKEDGLEEELMR